MSVIGSKVTMTVFIGEDGKSHFEVTNDGFNAFEFIGLLEWKKQDIMAQMAGLIKPDHVKRNSVLPDE